MRLVYQSQQITASKRKSISPVMKIHLFLVLALMGFSITSVLAQEGPGDGGDSKVALSEAETSINFKPSRNYRLKGGDEVQLIVYEEEELNKTTTLTPTGEATFLLIESINLNGLTLAEAGKKIENAFKPDYLKKPKVTLDLITAAAERVSVNGAVVSKGDVAISPGGTLDILGALLRAGGLSKEADKSKIIVTRGKDRQTYHYDALSERGADPVLLMNHDSIDVGVHPHANTSVLVIGEVHNPMDIPFPLDAPLTVGIALGRCGGPKATAHPSGITIQRGGKTYGLSSGSKTKLDPGDVLKVPPNPYIGKFVTVTGQVNTPGQVPFATNGSLNIATALTLAGGKTQIADLRKVSVLRTVKGKPTTYKMDVRAMLAGKQQMFHLRVSDIVVVGERTF